MESRLDGVSAGREPWRGVLRDFWGPFSGAVGEAMEAREAREGERKRPANASEQPRM